MVMNDGDKVDNELLCYCRGRGGVNCSGIKDEAITGEGLKLRVTDDVSEGWISLA